MSNWIPACAGMTGNRGTIPAVRARAGMTDLIWPFLGAGQHDTRDESATLARSQVQRSAVHARDAIDDR